MPDSKFGASRILVARALFSFFAIGVGRQLGNFSEKLETKVGGIAHS